MRTTLLILAGMILMYIILKYMSSKSVSDSAEWNSIKELMKTQQFNNLVKTNEFRELAKSSEFRNVVGTLAEDQIIQVSKTLIG